MLNKIKQNLRRFINISYTKTISQIEPDMNFLRRVAVKEAIVNVFTATRFETEFTSKSESLRGDYMKFGVFEGAMFKFVLGEAAIKMPWMRFFACDSFQGLPEPKGIDADAEFAVGQFSCNEERFFASITNSGVAEDRIFSVPGWFDTSLQEEAMAKHDIQIVTLAYIDCDLYESCIPVLKFLSTRVRQGTVLMFDDWFCFRANPRRGIPLAVAEWLQDNPSLELIPWRPFSSHGFSFFVNIH